MVRINNKKLLMEIVFLQTIGPLLVVLGHSMNGLPENAIFQAIKSFIYVFHMPLFFFVAGMLFMHSSNKKKITYKEYIKKKAVRLLIPYIMWNFIFLVPKILIQSYLADKVELSFGQILLEFITPRANILGHTWFLVSLFIVYSMAPLLLYLYKKNKIVFHCIVVLSIVLSCFPINTNIMTLFDTSKNLVFFLFGMLIFNNRKVLLDKKNKIIIITLLLASSFVLWVLFNCRITTVVLCSFILLFLLVLGLLLSKKFRENIISKNSMSFYLFHWPLMVAARVLFYQILHLNYLFVAGLMFIIGVTGPLLLIVIIDKLRLKEKSKIIRVMVGG